LELKNKTVRFEFDDNINMADLDSNEEAKIACAEKALETIGEKCWHILKAFYYEGLSMAKIALQFGFSSEKSAKNQKYKCLERAKLKFVELSK
jgi:hypothetical protein